MARFAIAGAYVAACSAATAIGVGAQQSTTSLTVGAVSVRYTDELPASALTLSPAFVLRSPNAFVALLGSVARLESGDWSPQGTLAVATFTPVTPSGFSGEVGFSLGGSGHSAGTSTGEGGANARLHWFGPAAGGWVGGSVGTTWTGAAWRSFRASEIGVALRREGSTMTLRATPTRTADDLRFTDLATSAGGAVGPLDLTASLGARFGAASAAPAGDQTIWGGLSLALWLAPRVALVASGGTYPVDLTQGFPAGRYLSVAVRLGGWRAVRLADASTARAIRREAAAAGIERVLVRRVDAGHVELRVHAPAASRVELMGDATLWATLPLAVGTGGWWTIVVEASVSTELLLRVDGGAWVVPPGTTPVTDEFGGRVGRLVLP